MVLVVATDQAPPQKGSGCRRRAVWAVVGWSLDTLASRPQRWRTPDGGQQTPRAPTRVPVGECRGRRYGAAVHVGRLSAAGVGGGASMCLGGYR